ncbi:ABC transporter ATP-binding protein [Nitriliruptor alkaliphilus]|uniref:ABC transporter ATP-binding protein n=1 Tax=Nitriliruptor alkaliphilus TaxID=427918 RepID=UPI000696D53C|nr:ATP-binding cassette domain-containing protein [Nitriliruptor alkaliphilus]
MPSPSDTTARLALRDLRKRFGDRTVLDGVDLDVGAGSIVLLTGSNGSGKTTLLRCVAGLARFEGTLDLEGHRLGSDGAGHPDVGYLPQSPGLPTWATVAEVLALFARLRRCAPDSITLPDGFLPPLDQPVGQLSGGQRQRVAFAVALLGAPSLLLLDEPAANLDDDGRAALLAILEGLAATGTSILVAAPSPGDLGGLPDRTVRLVDGRLASDTSLHVVGGTAAGPIDPRVAAADRDPQEVSA